MPRPAWAVRKRHILLIVPASLRKQWSQELFDKFSLPSSILESRSYNEASRKETASPFFQDGRIVITSYEFAAAKAEDVLRGQWDLVVFDEAHRCATPTGGTAPNALTPCGIINERFCSDKAAFRAAYLLGDSPNALVTERLPWRELDARIRPQSRPSA